MKIIRQPIWCNLISCRARGIQRIRARPHFTGEGNPAAGCAKSLEERGEDGRDVRVQGVVFAGLHLVTLPVDQSAHELSTGQAN